MFRLFLFLLLGVLALPLAAETLFSTALGPSGTLPQAVRNGTLRVVAPSGSQLFRSDLNGTPLLGIHGGFDDASVSGTETLSIFFDRKNRIDALELGGFGPSDSPVLLSGFASDPGASLANGTTSFVNGVLSLTATSFAEIAAVSFTSPQSVDLFAISAPEADAEGKGISLVSLSHTPQPQTLYREEFPNGRRSARPLADCGWDASSATGSGSGGSISPTQTVVAAGDLGSGDLGSTTATSGGLTFASASGKLFIGEEATHTSIGIVGSFKSTTLSEGENCDITPVDGMVVDEVTFSSFGGNDSPVLLSGFPSDPGATLDNGTAVFAAGTLTLTATSFAQLATLSFANPPVLTTLNIRCNSTNSGAGGVGIHALSYRAATASQPASAQIAGIFGDDHAEIFASQSDGGTKAIISTEEDWIDHDPVRYTGLELRWEQAGGVNGANVEVRPIIEVGGQWFASATSFATSSTATIRTPGSGPTTCGSSPASATMNSATTTGESTASTPSSSRACAMSSRAGSPVSRPASGPPIPPAEDPTAPALTLRPLRPH